MGGDARSEFANKRSSKSCRFPGEPYKKQKRSGVNMYSSATTYNVMAQAMKPLVA